MASVDSSLAGSSDTVEVVGTSCNLEQRSADKLVADVEELMVAGRGLEGHSEAGFAPCLTGSYQEDDSLSSGRNWQPSRQNHLCLEVEVLGGRRVLEVDSCLSRS